MAANVLVSYDQVYSNANESLAAVACSDGTHGLLTRGFTTFGSLPTFPIIGGAFAIKGYNSPACGTCLGITFNKTTINMIAIDVGGNGIVLSDKAMDILTGGKAVAVGTVNATVVQVASSASSFFILFPQDTIHRNIIVSDVQSEFISTALTPHFRLLNIDSCNVCVIFS
ncbi:Cerato-platanin-domain-containing protein [Rickenella mellea]|uniref:Cerato-platanin-domain-containing protein n=1 Tax=Rickenella mellea TaxID=50990 RepID=A0A4Y7PSX6_9AGAM|nr:Cerato-platanin-domain-containing protein [Rickenella mellea]